MQNWNRFFLLTTLILLTMSSAYSQDFQAGSIVNETGEEIEGHIQEGYEYILFKEEIEKEPIKYTADKIQAYTIFYPWTNYESVNLEYWTYEEQKLKEVKRTVFIKYLYSNSEEKGPLELFQFNYEIDSISKSMNYPDFFYIIQDIRNNKSIVLYDEKHLKTNPFVVGYKEAILQLKYTKDCTYLKRRVRNNYYKYKEKSLWFFIADYNNCKKTTNASPIRKLRLIQSLGGGAEKLSIEDSTFAIFNDRNRETAYYSYTVEYPINPQCLIGSGLGIGWNMLSVSQKATVPNNYENAGDTLNLLHRLSVHNLYLPVYLRYRLWDRQTTPYVKLEGKITAAFNGGSRMSYLDTEKDSNGISTNYLITYSQRLREQGFKNSLDLSMFTSIGFEHRFPSFRTTTGGITFLCELQYSIGSNQLHKNAFLSYSTQGLSLIIALKF